MTEADTRRAARTAEEELVETIPLLVDPAGPSPVLIGSGATVSSIGSPPLPPLTLPPAPPTTGDRRDWSVRGTVARSIAVVLLVVSLVVAFAAWFGGARFAAEQERAFSAYDRTVPLIADNTIAEQPWPAGVPVAKIRFPKFDRNLAVFPGGSRSDLERGPAYDPSTTFPGELGNSVIIGRRTTYGAPFSRVGELIAGDQLLLSTPAGNLAFRVTSNDELDHKDGRIYEASSDRQLTLVTNGGLISPTRVRVVKAVAYAGSFDRSVREPVRAKVVQRSFAPALFLLIAGVAALLVVAAVRWLPALYTRRTSWVLVLPFLAALSVPLARELLLLLPRTV